MNTPTAWPQFQFVELNRTRRSRGAGAARVRVLHRAALGDAELLWMNRQDLLANLATFGPHAGLQAALVAYETKP